MAGCDGSITLTPTLFAMLIEDIDWLVWKPALVGGKLRKTSIGSNESASSNQAIQVPSDMRSISTIWLPNRPFCSVSFAIWLPPSSTATARSSA
jgi:hypothetical protein